MDMPTFPLQRQDIVSGAENALCFTNFSISAMKVTQTTNQLCDGTDV
jgi:hypothetical protein